MPLGDLLTSWMPLARDSAGSWFLLEVDGVEIGSFRSVSGLRMSVEVVSHAEGGQNEFEHKFPGRMTWSNLTFTRGLVISDALFSWVAATSGQGLAAAGHRIRRCTGAVTALDRGGLRLRSWKLLDAFPVGWVGPDFQLDGDGELVEQLEVAHHGLTSATLPVLP